MPKVDPIVATSDWDVIMRVLPPSWELQARELGALQRARGIPDAETLLRVLLIHLAGGCSLIETAVRAEQAGLCKISSVALFKRLRAAEEWLRWLAESLWSARAGPCEIAGRRVRVVDASVVSEGGRTGSQWRVHFGMDLSCLQCDYFELTDVHGGESLRRFPVKAGDVILGDRAYSRSPGIAHVVNSGGDVLVRHHPKSLPLFTANGEKLPLLKYVRRCGINRPGEWVAYVHGPNQRIRGRLIVIKRSPTATERARLRMRRRAKHDGQSLSKTAMELASYVQIWTTLSREEFDKRSILKMYRWRWQIELAFKRMKSIMGLGQLPKRTDTSSRAWLHGKLFVALLLDKLVSETRSFSPWGYPIDFAAEPMARDSLPCT